MKTDEEIKEFIDNRDVLTKSDIARFMYGNKESTSRVNRWWDYVLETKDWGKLKKLREDKIYNNCGQLNKERYIEFKKIYKKDKRLHTMGKISIQRLLNNGYDFHIPLSTIQRYLCYIRQKKNLPNFSK